jgi:hypothetical protein
MNRRIALEGDVQPLLERVRYAGIGQRVLARLETKFIDEK